MLITVCRSLKARPRAGMPGGWTAARDCGLSLFMLRHAIPHAYIQPNENQLPAELFTKIHNCTNPTASKMCRDSKASVAWKPIVPPLFLTSTICSVFIYQHFFELASVPLVYRESVRKGKRQTADPNLFTILQYLISNYLLCIYFLLIPAILKAICVRGSPGY